MNKIIAPCGIDCFNCEMFEENVTYCFECNDFPCELLMPLADGASKFPQNIKLFNLCLMKKIGVEKWAEQSGDIRKTYFTKKIQIGEGGSK